MKPAHLDFLTWTLIYGGVVAVILGLSVQRSQPTLGWTLVGAGGVAALLGAALLVVRADSPNGSR